MTVFLISFGAAFLGTVLIRIMRTLLGILRELENIRSATVSMHDRVVPEVLMQRWERARRR